MAILVRAGRRRDRFTVEQALYRSRLPWQDPFPSDAFWNTPVGSGMTYVSTSDARHTYITSAKANLNTSDWTDPTFLATAADPEFRIEHRDFLPAGWASVTPTGTMAPSGAGPLNKTFSGVRIPAAARWYSTNNTDRKVLVVQPAITLVITDADGDLVSSTSYAAGTLAIEMHKFQRTTTSDLIFTTNLSKNDIVTGYGLTEGAIASGISPMQGYVRNWEQAAAAAGDKFAIKHALKYGLANAGLLAGPLFPARLQDGDAGTVYTGPVPYGTHIVLPPSFNVETFTVAGSPIDDETKAYLYALQFFGAYCLIRAGSDGVVSFGAEPISPMGSTRTNKIKAALTAALPFVRISANSHLVGTLDPVTRQPLDPTLIAGGGSRITVGRGLADFDNVTGLKLPFNPSGPWA